jgi:PAS domain S-box-containing protein
MEQGQRTAQQSPHTHIEESLPLAPDQLICVLGGMVEAVLIQDTVGTIVFVNDAAARLCGFDTAEAMRAVPITAVLERFIVFDTDGVLFSLADLPSRRVLAGEAMAETALRWRIIATGEERWTNVRATPIEDENGAVQYAVSVFRDITEQRAAEVALRESESHFRPLVQNISDIVKLLDADGTIRYQSPSVARILGYPPEERIGSNIFTAPIVHPDDLATKQAFLRNAIAHPDLPVTAAFRLRHADGSWREIEAVGVNLLDDPHVGGIVTTYRDVTERRRSEARDRFLSEASALLASSLDYETTIQRVAQLVVPEIADWCGVDILTEDGALDPLAVAHVDAEKVALAREFRRRYPPDVSASGGAITVLHTGRSQLVSEVTDAALAAVAIDDEHLRLMRALELRSVMVVPLTAQGRVLGRLTLVSSDPRRRYDPDDLRFAEELARRAAVAIDHARLYREAQAAEERYRSLFEGTADAVLVTDAEGRYRDANPAMVALVGYTVAELRQMAIGALTANTESSEARAAHSLRDGTWRGELELRRKDGTMIPVEGAITSIALPSGPLMLGTWRDITERRERERLQQEFLGVVAHELRTPLTSLRGYVDLMRRRGVYNERFMETVGAQTLRMNRLLNDVLEISRLDANRLALRRGTVDLGALIRQCIDEAMELTGTHPVRLELPDRPVEGWWDADRVMQVVQNLVVNAAKYAPAGTEITVCVEDCEDRARVAVIDRGIGIPPEDLPHLFDRFYRARNARAVGGMGLGLSISKALVEAHGGDLWAESTVDVGSTFFFTLPYADPPGDNADGDGL